jgi:hypothetical protein
MKLEFWEQFYNFDIPHGSLDGITPYEKMRPLLTDQLFCPAGADVSHLEDFKQ